MDNAIFLKRIGGRVRDIRKSKKISLRKLGDICGLDYSFICIMENGKYSPNVTTLKRIADALKVDIKEFL